MASHAVRERGQRNRRRESRGDPGAWHNLPDVLSSGAKVSGEFDPGLERRIQSIGPESGPKWARPICDIVNCGVTPCGSTALKWCLAHFGSVGEGHGRDVS
jgi:hypothetical protein